MPDLKIEFAVPFSNLSLEESLEVAKEAGFERVDAVPNLLLFNREPGSLTALTEKIGISVTSLHQPLLSVLYTPPFYIKPMLQSFRFFPKADLYVVHLSAFVNIFDTSANRAKKFFEFCQSRGIQTAFESNPPFPILRWYPRVTVYPEEFGYFCMENGLPMVFDTSHIAASGGDVRTFYEKFHKQIAVIHLSDYKNGVQHLPLGQGNLPLIDLLQSVKRSNESHRIVFEINELPHSKTFEDKKHDIMQSFKFAKSKLI